MSTLTTSHDEPRREAASAPGLMARLHEWTVTVDHKKLGVMYVGAGLLFFVIAGIQASLMRLQLMRPLNDIIPAETFNRLFTMHGTTMVFLVGMPVLLG